MSTNNIRFHAEIRKLLILFVGKKTHIYLELWRKWKCCCYIAGPHSILLTKRSWPRAGWMVCWITRLWCRTWRVFMLPMPLYWTRQQLLQRQWACAIGIVERCYMNRCLLAHVWQSDWGYPTLFTEKFCRWQIDIFFLAHLSLWLTCELIVWQASVVVVCSLSSVNIFFSETTGPIEVKFHVNNPWDGAMKVCLRGVQVTWPRLPPCSFKVKSLQKSSPEPVGPLSWNLVCSIGY